MARYICIESCTYLNQYYQKDWIGDLAGSPPAAYFTADPDDPKSPFHDLRFRKDLDGTLYFPEQNWDDLRFPATAINPPGQVSDPDIDVTDGTLLFDPAATEIIMGVAQMPHPWLEGSSLEAHIHWSPTDGAAGDVLWRFDYQWANIGDAFPGSWTSSDTVAATTETDDDHLYTDLEEMAGVGKTFSSMIKWRLSRIGGDVLDTYAADAKLLELDFHYRIDSVGSGKELAK